MSCPTLETGPTDAGCSLDDVTCSGVDLRVSIHPHLPCGEHLFPLPRWDMSVCFLIADLEVTGVGVTKVDAFDEARVRYAQSPTRRDLPTINWSALRRLLMDLGDFG